MVSPATSSRTACCCELSALLKSSQLHVSTRLTLADFMTSRPLGFVEEKAIQHSQTAAIELAARTLSPWMHILGIQMLAP